MKPSLRHQKIIEYVNQQGYLSTEELVQLLGVSAQTMRRDLNELAENNLISRHHGGAATLSNTINNDYQERKFFFSAEKERLALAVAKGIPNGSSLFIDIGTTPESIAKALLNHKDLFIVTNNINAASILMQNDSFKITLASGSLRQDGGILGESTMAFISQFRLDYTILGISAIDQNGDLLDYDYHEVQVKRSLIENAQKTILAVDPSKFSRRAIVCLGSLSEIDYLFVNQMPNPTIQALMHQHNRMIQVID